MLDRGEKLRWWGKAVEWEKAKPEREKFVASFGKAGRQNILMGVASSMWATWRAKGEKG